MYLCAPLDWTKVKLETNFAKCNRLLFPLRYVNEALGLEMRSRYKQEFGLSCLVLPRRLVDLFEAAHAISLYAIICNRNDVPNL